MTKWLRTIESKSGERIRIGVDASWRRTSRSGRLSALLATVVAGVFYLPRRTRAGAGPTATGQRVYLDPQTDVGQLFRPVGLIGTVVGGLALARSRGRVGPGQDGGGSPVLGDGLVALVVGGR